MVFPEDFEKLRWQAEFFVLSYLYKYVLGLGLDDEKRWSLWRRRIQEDSRKGETGVTW